MSQITVRYFARFRERLGLSEETVALSEDMQTLPALRRLLATRGPVWAELVGPAATALMLAINQELFEAGREVQLQDGDEVAFFPPVTGG